MEAILSPLVSSWERQGYAVLGEAGLKTITHAVWADNVFIFAASKEQFASMCQELTDAVYAHKLRWKPSSLEVLSTGVPFVNAIAVTVSSGQLLSFK